MSDPPLDPPDRPAPGSVRAPSIVIVNTGDGKGKSTAAFGTLLRAVARGWPTAVIQFLKSGEWKVGEEDVARRLGVDWWAIGDGFTWNSTDMDRTQAVAVEAWSAAAATLAAGRHRLVVLDEITYPLNWGWVPVEAVVTALAERPPAVNVILTGRDAPTALVDAADTVTEMVKIRHAYDRGILARRGLDY
jgi:cob(I)alamin adenosyltransferase